MSKTTSSGLQGKSAARGVHPWSSLNARGAVGVLERLRMGAELFRRRSLGHPLRARDGSSDAARPAAPASQSTGTAIATAPASASAKDCSLAVGSVPPGPNAVTQSSKAALGWAACGAGCASVRATYPALSSRAGVCWAAPRFTSPVAPSRVESGMPRPTRPMHRAPVSLVFDPGKRIPGQGGSQRFLTSSQRTGPV